MMMVKQEVVEYGQEAEKIREDVGARLIELSRQPVSQLNPCTAVHSCKILRRTCCSSLAALPTLEPRARSRGPFTRSAFLCLMLLMPGMRYLQVTLCIPRLILLVNVSVHPGESQVRTVLALGILEKRISHRRETVLRQ